MNFKQISSFFIFYLLALFIVVAAAAPTWVIGRQKDWEKTEGVGEGGRTVARDCCWSLTALSTALSAPISQIVFHTARFFILRRVFLFSLLQFSILFFFCCTTKKLSQSEIIFGNCVYAAGATGRGRRGTGGGTEKGRGRWRIAT